MLFMWQQVVVWCCHLFLIFHIVLAEDDNISNSPYPHPTPNPNLLHCIQKWLLNKNEVLTIFRDYFLYLRHWVFAVILYLCIFDVFFKHSIKFVKEEYLPVHEPPACIDLPPLPSGFILFLSFFYLVFWYFRILSL